MNSKKAYEMMKEDYIDKESAELCNQIEKHLERIITYDNGMLGTWEDKQVPNTYSHYADQVMETLLV